MKRSKIKYIIYGLAGMLSVSACSLDEQNYTEIEKEKYLNKAKDAENVLLGVYRNMVDEGLYRYHLSLLFTLPSDIAKCEGESTNGFRIMPANAYTSTQDEVRATWKALYAAIYSANDYLENLSAKAPTYNTTDRQLATIYMAEARCLRALYYFELLRWYGNVTLTTATSESLAHPSTFKQTPPEEIYKFIESDLKYAINNLPYAVDDNLRKDNSYRFSKGAALGLLTKVYATWAGYPVNDKSKWEEAAKTAKVLVESGKHRLLDDYAQLWKNTCNSKWDPAESLIEVSFFSPTITGSVSEDPSGRIGKWNGVTASGIPGIRNAGNWKVIPTFLKNWKNRENDKRWSISFADYRYTKNGKEPVNKNGTLIEAFDENAKDDLKKAFMNSLSPAKWDTEKYVESANYLAEANLSNINWYVLRYADVLLLYAEALNEWKQQPTSEAYTALNMVRRRGHGLPISTPNSSCDVGNLNFETFQQAVRDERSYELAFEGHRRQDLIRWGIYYESIKKTEQDIVNWYSDGGNYYICASFTKKGKHELMPIPQRELDMMKQYNQNPYWK